MRQLIPIAFGAVVLAAMVVAEAAVATAHPQAVAQASAADEGAPKDSVPKDNPAQDAVPDDGSAKAAGENAQKSRLVSILGREVTNRDGDGGRIIDVLVDLDGRSGAVVVEFGGFMGIGSRKVAVDWNALRFVSEGTQSLLTVDVSRNQIRDAPEYKPNEQPTVLTTK
ncbi:MAG: PRC-barrel domain-containing protein [Hyphomicrobiaceae bacterium]|nr:PRC-barrel domain-containing protein [Hyphomicrobiaceae bacterium]